MLEAVGTSRGASSFRAQASYSLELNPRVYMRLNAPSPEVYSLWEPICLLSASRCLHQPDLVLRVEQNQLKALGSPPSCATPAS